MVKRIWHGWTTHENADAYEKLLVEHVFPGIERKSLPGYRSIELLRNDRDEDVEFVTIMTFDSLDDIAALHGDHIRKSYVPREARELLSQWDSESAHYEVRQTRNYDE